MSATSPLPAPGAYLDSSQYKRFVRQAVQMFKEHGHKRGRDSEALVIGEKLNASVRMYKNHPIIWKLETQDKNYNSVSVVAYNKRHDPHLMERTISNSKLLLLT